MMIHIYDAILVGVCLGWITWQIADYIRARAADRLLRRLRERQIKKHYE